MKRNVFVTDSIKKRVVWRKIGNHDCIYVTLSEYITEEEIQLVIDKSLELNAKSNYDKSIVIWNALKMKGYETKARDLCQELLKETKDTTDSVWVISDSVLVHGVAEIISFFSSRTIKVVNSEKKLEEKLLNYTLK